MNADAAQRRSSGASVSATPAPPIANHTGRLILTAADPVADLDSALLIATLTRLAFIGAPLAEPPDAVPAFRIGSEFSSLVSFTGCAVQILDVPTPNAPFCHIRIPPLAPRSRLHYGRNTRAPRCPDCRGRLDDWQAHTAHWASPHWETRSAPDAICPHCGASHPLCRWDWKQQGGCGRLTILVEEVFPGEAVPTPALLERLAQASNAGWRYFYVQDARSVADALR